MESTIPPSVSVVFVDDDPLSRRSLRELLNEPGIDIVAECATGPACLEAVERHHPNVALVDLRLKRDPMAGIELIRRIRAMSPQTTCAIVTAESDDAESDDAIYIFHALRAGAEAYYSKTYALESLADLARGLATGEYTVEPRIARQMARFARDQLPPLKQTQSEQQQSLTPREREVLDLLAEGLKPGKIAERLVISGETVKRHKENIAAKLGISNQTLLVVYAVLARYLHEQPADQAGSATASHGGV